MALQHSSVPFLSMAAKYVKMKSFTLSDRSHVVSKKVHWSSVLVP